MSYLLMQILVCLLLAGLIGLLIGWWLRGGCTNKLRENDDSWNIKLRNNESDWERRVQSFKSDYRGETEKFNLELEALNTDLKRAKLESEDARIKLSSTNDDWSLKLREAEANWTGKLQGVMSDYDAQVGKNDEELQTLKADLKQVSLEKEEAEIKVSALNDEWKLKLNDVEENWREKLQALVHDYSVQSGTASVELESLKADLKLAQSETALKVSAANDEWSLKLRDTESSWEGKIQGLMSDYDSKVGEADTELESLKLELKRAKTELSDSNGVWNLKLKDLDANWNNKLQGVMSDYDGQVGNADVELESLRAELKKAKSDLINANETWDLKLKESKSQWEGKLQGVMSDYDGQVGNADKELETLRAALKTAKTDLTNANETWGLKLKESESRWEGKLQGVMSDYDGQVGDADKELETLRVALASTKSEVSRANDAWNLKLKDSELRWEAKLQGVMQDYDEQIKNSDAELKSLKSNLASVQTELSSTNDTWNLKLKGTEAHWTTKLQGVMSDYDGQIDDADKELASLKSDLGSAQTEAKLSAQALIDIDKELFEAEGNIETDYEVTELEGVGPAYGKKFNAMGIKTTSDYAKKFLNDDMAVKKAASETGIEADAIKSWASMADLMKLPSVGGQYAEILQAVGISSRKELTKVNAKSLHRKMVEYNTSHAIVPEVPSVALILRWVKSPDASKIAEAISAAPSSKNDMEECYEIEEVEGIGPAYGKKFRAIDIKTTCDLAKAYLKDKGATKSVAKNLGIDANAIKSWASMADLMRLPGVGGQFAEIMQTVGIDSRLELKSQNANKLHTKMSEYNAKHAIVPEVPTVQMIVAWIKASK